MDSYLIFHDSCRAKVRSTWQVFLFVRIIYQRMFESLCKHEKLTKTLWNSFKYFKAVSLGCCRGTPPQPRSIFSQSFLVWPTVNCFVCLLTEAISSNKCSIRSALIHRVTLSLQCWPEKRRQCQEFHEDCGYFQVFIFFN